jgi:hypothetical protein
VGRAFGLEVKRPGESPSVVQLAFHDRLRGAGVPVAVVRGVDEAERVLCAWNLPLGEPWEL